MKLNFKETIVDRTIAAVKAAKRPVASVEMSISERHEMYRTGDSRVTKLDSTTQVREAKKQYGVKAPRALVSVDGRYVVVIAEEHQ